MDWALAVVNDYLTRKSDNYFIAEGELISYHEYMRRSIAKLRGLAYIVWHAKHMLFHVLLGLMWAWILREIWGEFSMRWVITSMIGSVLPDADHFLYFFTYGRRDPYTKMVFTNVKNRHWRVLVTFLEKGHKHNTNLTFHNIYSIITLLVVSAVSFIYDWKAGVLLSGSMISHYVFDITEDLLILGKLNPNWKRFGRPKARFAAHMGRRR